jgi:zinc protease
MNTRQRLIGLALISGLLITATNPAMIGAQQQPEHRSVAVVRYESQQSLGKGVTKAQLTNGLTVLVQENHAAPVATVRCYVKNTGSAYEGRYLGAGLSHMLEHLVAGGTTTKKPEKEIQRLLDTMGGQTNAFTSTDVTAYYIDCPAKQVSLAMELIAEAMQFAMIPEDEYVREMGVVQRELEMGEEDRDRMLYQAMKSLIFTEHPVRHPTIGYLAVVQQVKRPEVINFYKSRYVPQNMIYIVTGDVNTQQVLDHALALFKDFQRTTERGVVLAEEPDQASPRSTRMEMEGETTHFSIAWPTVALQHPDLYPLDVASYLLTYGDSSRITRRLKVEQPLAISVDSSSYTPGFVKGWFDITVECTPDNVAKCRQVVDEEIERLKRELVSPAELAKVKRQKAAEHVFGQQTVQAQADSLARSFMSTGDPLFDDQYVAGIQRVTAEQIRDVARRYFLPERLNTVVIDPIGTAQQATTTTAESVESPVIRKQLSNGLTVLLKRHAVLPLVSIQAFVNGGVLSDTAETSGRAALACELMTRGTEKYSGDQIANYFDSIGGAISVESQRNTSYLRCSILKEDFETSMDYVYQVLLRPTFAADQFTKVQQYQLGRIAARKANPQAEILDFWSDQLPAANPYSRRVLGKSQTVAKLTAADCRQFHKAYLVPNNMVLAIYGDIDPVKTLAMIEQSFGKEPKSPSFKFPEFAASHSLDKSVTANLPTQRADTAMVIVSHPTVNVLDEKTRSTLDVFNGILTGGGGSGGRLFDELRGETLVYYVFGFEITGQAPGYFLFLAQTRPETVGEVTQRIQAAVAKIGKEGVPAEELELAKIKLIAAHAQQNNTPSSQAFQACIDELYGLGHDYDKTYESRITGVTSNDLKSLVARYFQNSIIATSSPEPAAK